MQQQGDVDDKILKYCSIDGKQKKSLGEMEQEFLQALQVWFDHCILLLIKVDLELINGGFCLVVLLL